jgi:hypothetical protein
MKTLYNIPKFFSLILFVVIPNSYAASPIWMSSPSYQQLGESKIYVQTNFSKDKEGNTSYSCYFGEKVIGDDGTGFSISEKIVLPTLENSGIYTWSVENGWVIVKKKGGDVYMKFSLDIFD